MNVIIPDQLMNFVCVSVYIYDAFDLLQYLAANQLYGNLHTGQFQECPQFHLIL